MATLRNGVPQEHVGWLKSGRLGKRRYYTLRGIMLMKYKSPEDEPEWSCSMLNCEIFVNQEKLRVHIPKWRLLLSAETSKSFDEWIRVLMYASRRIISNHYELFEKIGEGMSGVVRRGVCLHTGETVAVKIVNKGGLSQDRLTRLQNEAVIMIAVRSPQIVSTIDLFDEEQRVCVVMEHLKGGTLADMLEIRGTLTEEQMRSVMTEIIHGLAALHCLRIVHRDIKLENILCSFDTFPLGTKLVDFGFGAIIPDANDISNALQTMLGTWNYISPEQVSRKPYGPPVDMWAAGVVMYKCLIGKFPFEGDTPSKIMRMIRKGSLPFGEEWNQYSDNCRDFASRVLDFDAEGRMTVEECLVHPWICENEKSLALINEDPIHEELRQVQEIIRTAKRMFLSGGLYEELNRDGSNRSSTERSSLKGSLEAYIPTSPSSLVSDREMAKKRNIMGGMLMNTMMGNRVVQQGFTPPLAASTSPGLTSTETTPPIATSMEENSAGGENMRGPRRRGKGAVQRDFDIEDHFANEGDWV